MNRGTKDYGGAPDTAHMARLFVSVHTKDVVLSFGFVLSRWAPLRMYLFGTVKGHNGSRAISKIIKWVPIDCALDCARFVGRGGCLYNLWPKCLLSLRAILGGGKNQGVLAALAAKKHKLRIATFVLPGEGGGTRVSFVVASVGQVLWSSGAVVH